MLSKQSEAISQQLGNTTGQGRLYFGGRIGLVDCVSNMASPPGTFLVIEIVRYSELAVVLDEKFLIRVENELWNLLESQVDGRASVFGIDSGEFGILWSHVLSEEEAGKVCIRLLDSLRGMSLCRHEGLKLRPRIGVVRGWRGIARPHEWIHCAYLALGNSRRPYPGFSLYQPSMADNLTRQWEMRRDLAIALDMQQFCLFYQPRVDLSSGLCTGIEALIRWRRPEGLVAPDDFMPMLEDSGVILELTHWVINQSAAELSEWLAGDESRSLAVNVSPRALTDSNFVDCVAKTVSLWSLNPEQLILEITEGAAWEQREVTVKTLDRLRDMGIRIAIDDFGTGHSTLEYLRLMPADELKIDKTFVQNMMTSSTDLLLVKQVIDIGHQLGMRVVAEGTEMMDQVIELQKLGCDSAQGFGIGRPMEKHEFLSWSLQFPTFVPHQR